MTSMRLILAIVLVIFIGFGSALSVYYGFFFLKITEIDMDMTVADKIGINADTDALHFGRCFPGAESRRRIFISNKNDFPVVVNLRTEGSLAKWVSVEETEFILNPYQNNSIDFVASPPQNAEFGTYEGISIVTVKKKLW